MNAAVAIPAGVAAAGTFAVSSVLQQRAARRAPESETLSWRLLVDLAHRPVWLAGMGCTFAAFALQSLALAFGPIGLVEPLITTELVFAVPLAMALRRQRPGRREWLGAVVVAAGVAAFIVGATPRGGNPEPGWTSWAVVVLPVAVLAGLALVAARGPETPRRARFLAAAAGLAAAVVALVTQSFVVELSSAGLAGTLVSWQPYAMVLLGPATLTIAQSAFQSAPLAVSLPIIDSLEPVVATLMAALAFSQHISTAPFDIGLELAGAVLAVAGITALARSPLVLSIYEQQQRQRSQARHAGSCQLTEASTAPETPQPSEAEGARSGRAARSA